jgi:hypothetical protein
LKKPKIVDGGFMPKQYKKIIVEKPPVQTATHFGIVAVDVLTKRSAPSLQANVLAEKGNYKRGDRIGFVSFYSPIPNLVFGLTPEGHWVVIRSGQIDYINIEATENNENNNIEE